MMRGCDVTVFTEQGVAGSSERPADILVKGFQARPLYIDTTVYSRHLYSAEPLDAVFAAKLAYHKPLCAQEGWTAKICAADVCGFIHPTMIPVLLTMAKRVAAKRFLENHKLEQKAVWAAISAAVVSRSSTQMMRNAATEDVNDDEEGALCNPNPLPGLSEAPLSVTDNMYEDSNSECPMEINGDDKALEVLANHCGAKAVEAMPAMDEDAGEPPHTAKSVFVHNPNGQSDEPQVHQPSQRQLEAVAWLRQRLGQESGAGTTEL